ncbi:MULTISPECIES: DUF5786 family protein [unclassified Haladaptatus]|uniref:DUF5786 family protein n=1 Tax=unclassified Haladaptatus TaxID=2622732 RepID=UPI0023E76080|nr:MULTISPECIES: DUF5786 family protein [unclassified Haladaptatus]
MSMGAYDEQEHMRREEKTSRVNADNDDDTRLQYEGKVEYDSGDSAEALLEQFKKMKQQ